MEKNRNSPIYNCISLDQGITVVFRLMQIHRGTYLRYSCLLGTRGSFITSRIFAINLRRADNRLQLDSFRLFLFSAVGGVGRSMCAYH